MDRWNDFVSFLIWDFFLILDGQCGICGEPANSAKIFEKGGSGYRGNIVRTYSQGQIMNVVTDVS